jgi:hypothetical protein
MFDLLRCARTCKDFREYFDHKGWLKLLEKLVFKYDLEYFPDNISWPKMIERYDKIDRSIRNGYAVVNCIATPARAEENIADSIGVISFNDDYAVLNWTVTEGLGSGSFDVVTHSGVVDLSRRTLVQTRNGPKATRVVGSKLGIQEFNSYYGGDAFDYAHGMILKEFDDCGEVDEASDVKLAPNTKARGIVTNKDPSMRHIVAIVSPIIKSESLVDRADLEIVIYDTKAAVELTKIVLVDASEAQLYSKPYNVVLKGNLVYYSENIHPVSESTLHVIDWTNHNVRKKIILPGTWSDIHCVHKSFVFGTTSRDWNNRYIFAYDLSTGKYLERKKSMHHFSTDFAVLCGYLVYKEESVLYFIDYRGDTLDIVSSLALGEGPNAGIMMRVDGSLINSRLRGSVQIVDFENTCDIIEVMVMTSNGGQMSQEVMSFQAHELPEKLKAIFGQDFMSRYYRIKANERCGIIYRRKQKGDKLPLSQKYLRHKVQYNSPYFYHKTQVNGNTIFDFQVHSPNFTESGFCGTVAFFYEQWDGTRFKLSKPNDWKKVLLKD